MLVKITTKKGVILATPNPNTILFSPAGIEFFDLDGRDTYVSKKDLLDIEISDIQSYESNYKMNGVDVSSCVGNNKNVITIRIKTKWLRLLITWLFGPLITKT